MTKLELSNLGENYVYEFCELNNIQPPQIKYIKNFMYGCGYYSNHILYICLEKCALEASTPGWSWSHRHYFVDREPCGVICHEFGHYIHDILTKNKLVLPKEKPITSYEPNALERFAETIKLFILNPDLLKQYDPKRYNVLINQLHLKPIFNLSWKELMEQNNMNYKYIKSAQHKINN